MFLFLFLSSNKTDKRTNSIFTYGMHFLIEKRTEYLIILEQFPPNFREYCKKRVNFLAYQIYIF